MGVTSIRAKLGILRRCARILLRRRALGIHVWIPDNPYSDMLYRKFDGALAPEPMTYVEELDAFTRLPARRRLLWIHSEASYSWGRTGDDLAAAHQTYLASLKRWSSNGGKLVWTVHDTGLHLNDPDPGRIQSIREKLRDVADCVHVHSEAAKGVVVRDFGVAAERIVVVPHPSYAPLYSKADPARHQPTGLRRLLCFGNVKAYKNYDGLAAAIEALGPGSFERMTIAGKSDGTVVLPAENYRRSVDLDLRLRFIPDEEVPQLFGDADFRVLPYTESLTSGAAALSMGFGVPVIAPDLGGMREAVPEANRPLIYAPDDPDGLKKALRRARDMTPDEYDRLAVQCQAFGAAIHPDRISAALIGILSERRILPGHSS